MKDENEMENTNQELQTARSGMGIISFILSRREGQQFLAGSLILIIFLFAYIGRLQKKNDDLHGQIDALHQELKSEKTMDDERYIRFIEKQNASLAKFKNQVDSAKAALEIYNIKREMK